MQRWLLLPAMLSVSAVCGCRRQPGEPVFVIGGSRPADTCAVVTAPETLHVAIPDTISLDTLPADTVESVPPDLADVRLTAFEVRGSLYESLSRALPDDAPDVLAAHLVRCLWWDIDPWNDMCAGDSLIVLFGDGSRGIENRTVAVRYVPVSGSASSGFSVYLFLRAGDNYPSYWHADGSEAALMLNTMPISTFEEITGIYGEPRGDHQHAGQDFKAPEGTPVRTARGGTVARLDWNTSYNGRCIEIEMGGGYSEIFLHLSTISAGVVPGAFLAAGTVVGAVGNTGRSYSAHLHYQINDESDRPIDPRLFFGTHRRQLEGADLQAFRAFCGRCDAMMSGGL